MFAGRIHARPVVRPLLRGRAAGSRRCRGRCPGRHVRPRPPQRRRAVSGMWCWPRRWPCAAAPRPRPRRLIAAICFAQWLAGVLAERRSGRADHAVLAGRLGATPLAARGSPRRGRDRRASWPSCDGHRRTHQWLSGLMATGTVTAALVVGLYVRTRRAYLASMIERAETAERDRDRQAQIAVADERTRMAREMHDVIAHSLAVMITLNDAAVAVDRRRDGPRHRHPGLRSRPSSAGRDAADARGTAQRRDRPS